MKIYVIEPNCFCISSFLWCSVRAPEWPPHLETINRSQMGFVAYAQILITTKNQMKQNEPQKYFKLGGGRRKRVRVTVNRCNRASAPFRIPELPTNDLHTTSFSFAVLIRSQFQRTFSTQKATAKCAFWGSLNFHKRTTLNGHINKIISRAITLWTWYTLESRCNTCPPSSLKDWELCKWHEDRWWWWWWWRRTAAVCLKLCLLRRWIRRNSFLFFSHTHTHYITPRLIVGVYEELAHPEFPTLPSRLARDSK
jgi:hypothetical protein